MPHRACPWEQKIVMAAPTRYNDEILAFCRKECEQRTLSELWDLNAERFPDKVAIVSSTARVTWREAKSLTDRLALGLIRLGIEKDQFLGIQLPTILEFPLFRVACEKAGILSAALLPRLRDAELEHTLGRLQAVGIVIPRMIKEFEAFETIRRLRPRLPHLKHILVTGSDIPEGTIPVDDLLRIPPEALDTEPIERRRFRGPEVSYLNFTSGSTGFPKFVEYPAWARPTLGRGLVKRLKIQHEDRIGIFTPGVGGPTLLGFYGAPHVGCPIVLLDMFDAETGLELIEKERITVVSGVDVVLSKLLRHPNWAKTDLSSVRLWYMMLGGAAALAEEVESRAGKVVNLYGAADFGLNCIAGVDDDDHTRLRTLGKPVVSAARLKIVDPEGHEVPRGQIGEILGKCPSCASGYYGDPATTWDVWTRDGWYRTRDLGRFDEAGNLVLEGRIKEMIKRGGQNIFPAEIEKILISHPKVASVAIVSMPDPELTERACAYVVPMQGQKFTFDEMVNFLKSKGIATFKIPERLEIIDEMPMVAEGQKVNKPALEKDIRDKILASMRP